MPTRLPLKARSATTIYKGELALPAAPCRQRGDHPEPSPTTIALSQQNSSSTPPRRQLQPPLSSTISASRRGSSLYQTANNNSSSSRRSSILRERIANTRSRDDDDDDHKDERQEQDIDDDDDINLRLSSNDIRASPRLLGYLFSSIAAAVMFVSIIQFYRTQKALDIFQIIVDPSNKYVAIKSSNDFIYRYKLLGAFFLSAVGCFATLMTVLVHFDTVLVPKFWNGIFQDGSPWEGGWIGFWVVFWAVNIHISTSSFSVGQVQANVYFTAWLAFGASLSCLEIWRESAAMHTANTCANENASAKQAPTLSSSSPTNTISRGRFRLVGRFLDRQHHRETTNNWAWTGICSAIFAGAVSDLYYNRSAIKFLYQGAKLTIDEHAWIIILALVWAEVALCFVSVFLNEWLYKPYRLPCQCRRKGQVYRCVYGWRQVEGLLMTLTLGGKFYILLVYTGVDGPINGLSNAYFGLWGSFFNGSFLLGTWLRENKKIAFIIRDDDQEDEEDGVDDKDAELNAAFDYDYN